MADPKKEYAGGIRAGARPTTLNLDKRLHGQLKMLSAMTNRTMSDLVESWIVFYAPIQTNEGMTWTAAQQKGVKECLLNLDAYRDELAEAADAES